MLARLKFLLSYFLFWILFFEGARLLFLVYNLSAAQQVSGRSKALSFLYGLRMDISVSSYFLLPVVLLVAASVYVPFLRKAIIYKIYTWILLFFALLITLADLEVYKSWGFRIDATPLKYLDAPREVWASISHLPLFLIFLVFALTYVSLGFLLNRFLQKRIYLLQEDKKRLLATAVLVLLAALLIIPIRGGLQQTPMNVSMVYFSRENFANVTAVNATWNVMNGLAKGAPVKNPYLFYSAGKAAALTDSLYKTSGTTRAVLKTKKPNVILIIWESLTQKALEQEMNGQPILPRLRELKKEGIFFSNIYSSGDRTDKGVAAVLAGYPAMNNVSIIRFPKKSAKLHTLPHYFHELGYHTSFYYGGETEFANIKSFLLQSRFDRMVDKNDFDSKDQNSKWGAHDGVVSRQLIEELSKQKEPFFSTWLTLSSHEPFEIPGTPAFPGKQHAAQFASSLHYTDQVVYDFISACKSQPWWEQTLVVIVADHGHSLLEPSNWIENFRIPMLWLGGALARTGWEHTAVASQVDLAKTLAAQISVRQGLFPYSKNIFDSTVHPWAYFSFNNGFGFAQPQKTFVYDHAGRQIILQRGSIDSTGLEAGKALQQQTFQDYINK